MGFSFSEGRSGNIGPGIVSWLGEGASTNSNGFRIVSSSSWMLSFMN
jgi:hypothetical protein